MSSGTLSSIIAKHLHYDVCLQRLSFIIPKLGLKTRKLLLSLCQTEETIHERPDIDLVHKEMKADYMQRDLTGFPRMDELRTITTHIASKVVYRSFVAMLCKNEALDPYSGAEQAIEEGFIKELMSGQIERQEELRISYQCIDPDNYHPAQYSIYYSPSPWWLYKAKGLAIRFAGKLDQMGIIFPQVQRRKNMSTDSCRNLVDAGYETEDWRNLRTLDLELHKSRTGIQTQGDCEMRMAWKYNDLKPRFYYCIGASNYWRARHMKPVAVALMESVDSTKLSRRQDPTQIEFYLQAENWLVLWDLYSFTTQLSELKHFLFYVAKALQEDLRVQQRPLRLLDYADGVIEMTADQFLLQYNSGENYNAPYSVWRVCQQIYNQFEADEMYQQNNSGMLGVPGNIGLSTAFHGFHLECGVIEGTGCSVGDDALGGTKEDPHEMLIPHMQLIGDIHPEKITVMPPIMEYDKEQVGKFLKRRLTRTQTGITLGLLYAFPTLADVYQIKDGYHTLRDIPLDQRISKFVTQVGAFFWDLHATGWVEADELKLIDVILRNAYRKLELPMSGSLPGRKHRAFGEHMMMAVPSLDFNPCNEDWAEYLWDNTQERYALLPLVLGPMQLPFFIPCMEFDASEGGFINVLEDVGSLEKLRMLTEWVEVDTTNRRLFRSFLSGESRSYRCRYTNYCPPWFSDIFYDKVLYRVPIHDVV